MERWPDKLPGEEFDYGFDWSKRMKPSDTIASVAAATPAGMEAPVCDHEEALQRVRLKGGVPGLQYVLLTATLANAEADVLQEVVMIHILKPPLVGA